MRSRNPAKRIPKSLGTETKLFGRYTLTDLAVVLLPGVLVILAMQIFLPSEVRVGGVELTSITLPLAVVAIAFGALFVYLTPAYTTSVDWLATVIGFHQSDRELTHEAARAYTQIERIHPELDVIERSDGAFLGLVQVEPPTMALATDAEWQRKATAFQDVLNTAVDFPIQIFSTTRGFPAEQYLDTYRDRLSDPDVQANPQLTALIEHYVEWYAEDLADRRMTIRDHYVVVPVTPGEVKFERESLTQKFARLPILGAFVRAWFATRVAEEQAVMADALDGRLRRIETGLRDIEGCATRRVAAPEATRLIAEFWAGESIEYDDMRAVLRTSPVVGRKR